MVTTVCMIVLIIAVAFVPSLLYMVRVRNWERFGREPYTRLLLMFGYGAFVAVIITLILSSLVLGELMRFERLTEVGGEHFLSAVVVAPIVEELAKGLGLVFVIAAIKREEDGMVYGAAIGLGFAATENLLYELNALATGGIAAYIATAFLRIISSTLLHATATGVTGFGVGRAVMTQKALVTALPFYLTAVLMHATFNFIASLPSVWPDTFGVWTGIISLLLVILFAGFAWRVMRERISES
ncbi:MAG: PrsW family intramembrane metalloprotease [Thermoplasmata archaeon]|nr:MAG: PrsW family intramembrane metalloprotease [Thermoplasmata archaeon]